jgi:hypothetical protein
MAKSRVLRLWTDDEGLKQLYNIDTDDPYSYRVISKLINERTTAMENPAYTEIEIRIPKPIKKVEVTAEMLSDAIRKSSSEEFGKGLNWHKFIKELGL